MPGDCTALRDRRGINVAAAALGGSAVALLSNPGTAHAATGLEASIDGVLGTGEFIANAGKVLVHTPGADIARAEGDMAECAELCTHSAACYAFSFRDGSAECTMYNTTAMEDGYGTVFTPVVHGWAPGADVASNGSLKPRYHIDGIGAHSLFEEAFPAITNNVPGEIGVRFVPRQHLTVTALARGFPTDSRSRPVEAWGCLSVTTHAFATGVYILCKGAADSQARALAR